MRKIIFIILIIINYQTEAKAQETPAATAAAAVSQSAPKSTEQSDPQFREKLVDMLKKIEASVKILRKQITQNQSAPFLADLYMQMGDLLSQKSTVLYYIQMESDKNTDLKVAATKKFSPVVAAQNEAIVVYNKILKEFPKFSKRHQVLYRLAVGQKSIDEGPAFVETSEKLIREFPKEKEATQARLLVGQYFFDMQDHNKALSYLRPALTVAWPFERNAARYRIGLIRILEGQHREALSLFELIATDSELKEEDNPFEVSLKTKTTKTNIKREALIDSVRAYTEVYKNDPDPVAYYSKIAPTEVLFQETIEKLSFRYIFLKKYNSAINLLRTLAERTADPQKIVSVYHEVLLMIPLQERLKIPVEEMAFVLDRYNDWATHYFLSSDTQKKSFDFFETQIRELGTRSHDFAKVEKDASRKKYLFERARQFYELYLGFFDKSDKSVKISINLADVYYNQGNYFKSGTLYLRIFEGEFGQPTNKTGLIQNAILALQKPVQYDFYEQLRVKGLLVKAIQTYQNFDKKMKNDPSLNFTLAKTFYEQGYYTRALNDLLQFMKKYPAAKEVEAAADLILDYFNTRNDVKNLVAWTQKMLDVNPRSSSLVSRLKDVKSKGLLKRLDEEMKSKKDYDVFAQGKSYLQTALSTGDAGLRSAAFEQALGRSRAERDIETFLKTAMAMAKSEKKPKERGNLFNSLADETMAIGRFRKTMQFWQQTLNDKLVPASVRQENFVKTLKLAMIMRDLPQLSSLVTSPMMKSVPGEIKSNLNEQLLGMIDSEVHVPAALFQIAFSNAKRDEDQIVLFKSQYKAPAQIREKILRQASSACRSNQRSNVCLWQKWPNIQSEISNFSARLAKTPTKLTSIEPAALQLNKVLDIFKAYENSNDPQLDVLVALGTAEAYSKFSAFLLKTATANPGVKALLASKAKESSDASRKFRSQCKSIIASTQMVTPSERICSISGVPSAAQVLKGGATKTLNVQKNDLQSSEVVDKQKSIFVNRTDWKQYFDLAEMYLNSDYYGHAAAAAVYGSSTFSSSQEEFNAILGCAVLKMGFVKEARFHLEKASDVGGHRQSCLSYIKNEVRKP